MKKKEIFSKRWHSETLATIKQELGSLTALPNALVFEKLKGLEVTMLEVVEDRSKSTVYRIRQTGEIHQVFMNGSSFYYRNIEKYTAAEKSDLLKEEFKIKKIIFRIEVKDSKKFIYHEKYPEFYAEIIEGTIANIVFTDEITDQSKISSLLRKAEAFIQSYMK